MTHEAPRRKKGIDRRFAQLRFANKVWPIIRKAVLTVVLLPNAFLLGCEDHKTQACSGERSTSSFTRPFGTMDCAACGPDVGWSSMRDGCDLKYYISVSRAAQKICHVVDMLSCSQRSAYGNR